MEGKLDIYRYKLMSVDFQCPPYTAVDSDSLTSTRREFLKKFQSPVWGYFQ